MNPFELPLLPGDVAIVEIGHTYVGGSARERLFTDREASVTAAVDGLAVRLITRVRHPKPSVITLGIPVLAALVGAARYWARERQHWASTRREVRCGSLCAVNLGDPEPPRQLEPVLLMPIAPEAYCTARLTISGGRVGEVYRLPDDVELTATRRGLEVRRGEARIGLRPGAELFLAELLAVLAPDLAERLPPLPPLPPEPEDDPFHI